MSTFRALCAELVEKLDELNCNFNVPSQSVLIERALEELAKPEPVSLLNGEGMSCDLVRALLRPGYEPGDGSAEGAQLVNQAWWHPVIGCDSLQVVVDNARDLLQIVADNARAELAKPEPVGPTDDGDVEIDRWLESRPDWPDGWPAVTQCQLTALIGEALEHWGRPAIAPTPVSERPWERDGWRDAEGTCWMWHPVNFHYCLCLPDPSVHTHSLPHWALHLPLTTEAP